MFCYFKRECALVNMSHPELYHQVMFVKRKANAVGFMLILPWKQCAYPSVSWVDRAHSSLSAPAKAKQTNKQTKQQYNNRKKPNQTS